MRRGHLVVPVGPDDEQITGLRVGHQMLEKPQARRVDPLQVVEKQNQRVLAGGEHFQEARQDPVESILRLRRRQVGHRGLRAENVRDIGEDVDHELAVDVDRTLELISPSGNPLLALREDLPNELPQGFDEGRIGDIALERVELS